MLPSQIVIQAETEGLLISLKFFILLQHPSFFLSDTWSKSRKHLIGTVKIESYSKNQTANGHYPKAK